MEKVKLDIIRYARKVFKDTGRPPSVREILKELKNLFQNILQISFKC